MKHLIIVLILLLLAFPVLAQEPEPLPVPPPANIWLPITPKSQVSPTATEQGDCFAAAVAMVAEYVNGTPYTVNDIMIGILGGDEAYLERSAINFVDNFDLIEAETGVKLKWLIYWKPGYIEKQIANDNPVIGVVYSTDQWDHAVVIAGYNQWGELRVYDPYYGYRHIQEDQLLGIIPLR